MVNKKIISELLNESSCSHNKTKKSSCDKPKPGATSGGCAFEGSQISLFPFADVVHLVHSPATCIGASWETRQTLTSYDRQNNTVLGYTTDVNTNDIIFGGNKKLEDSIKYILENKNPKAIFVYETCVTAMIGDDMDNVCTKMQQKYNIPIVVIHSPGFVGGKNLGSRLGAESLFHQLIGTKEPESIHPFGINLIGEYNVTGDMWQYTPILEKIGIKVVSTLAGDGRIENIQMAHRAKLNVIVCAKSLISFTRKMQEKYQIPYVSVSFYGKRDTSNAIRSIVNAFGNKDLSKKAEKIIKQEEEKLEKELLIYKEILKNKKAILNTGGNKSWSIASALQDIGIEVVATSVKKTTLEDKQIASKYVNILMENPAVEQAQLIDQYNVDILLAGGRSLYTAIKKKVAFVDVNQEKKVSYGGYRGLINLAKDILFAVNNRVFKIVGISEPWN
ncbi:nitrogenase molybdenum-cofactor biosynthesis protein NifE [Malaciobacter molluscorum LMG 25693]|uniref:Nitrogenase [Fe-Mo] cofactor synthase, NifEN complex, NifE protein n=1 Tax=Malaciobacter molluscorum LMG 25693 TaxID=870501 RepID=A0A2G1DIY4_9BACT|nr:nitrogenase component 1 [Malaciobacter molluscorum]AXX93215.1 nitrogenase [Fe-Mo] cofactor synthase, NifEN complex, NifE protein [Malaciobacter molluscorum LMG 25693]PHO18469.1 nitrogenase molybdenum-cofactor biosynthesis protein NifE [Malaciobacter molluscorum LMG 25693]